MTKTLIEQYVEDPDNLRRFQQERAIFEITDLIESALEKQGLSRADLAEKLGVSEDWVAELLDGESHKTIRTIADTLAVIGHAIHFSLGSLEVGLRKDE
jgi:ribosome-binding protein aMBF1 (putative translation factor)